MLSFLFSLSLTAGPVLGRFFRAVLKLLYNTLGVANSVLCLRDTSALVIIGKLSSGSPRFMQLLVGIYYFYLLLFVYLFEQ